jgi:hypothetical protein
VKSESSSSLMVGIVALNEGYPKNTKEVRWFAVVITRCRGECTAPFVIAKVSE